MDMTLLSRGFLAAAVATAALGDDWAAATTLHRFSEDGTRFVRVVPGTSIGDTMGFASAPKGPWAAAEIYERRPDGSYALVARVTLRNPVAPVEVMISNSGAMLTLDNWHNAGYGEVVAIYSAKGALVRSYRLEDLYGPGEVEAVPRSVSSRWWRDGPVGFTDPAAQTAVYVSDFRRGHFVFDLATGLHSYEPPTVVR
jgi:hypothetical protein